MKSKISFKILKNEDKILLASLGRDLMEQQYKGTQMPQMDTDCFNVNAHYEPLIIR